MGVQGQTRRRTHAGGRRRRPEGGRRLPPDAGQGLERGQARPVGRLRGKAARPGERKPHRLRLLLSGKSHDDGRLQDENLHEDAGRQGSPGDRRHRHEGRHAREGRLDEGAHPRALHHARDARHPPRGEPRRLAHGLLRPARRRQHHTLLRRRLRRAHRRAHKAAEARPARALYPAVSRAHRRTGDPRGREPLRLPRGHRGIGLRALRPPKRPPHVRRQGLRHLRHGQGLPRRPPHRRHDDRWK